MSTKEFDQVFETSLSVVQEAKISLETKHALLALMNRVKDSVASSAISNDDALNLVKQIVVASVLAPEEAKLPA